MIARRRGPELKSILALVAASDDHNLLKFGRAIDQSIACPSVNININIECNKKWGKDTHQKQKYAPSRKGRVAGLHSSIVDSNCSG